MFVVVFRRVFTRVLLTPLHLRFPWLLCFSLVHGFSSPCVGNSADAPELTHSLHCIEGPLCAHPHL